jgi:DNA (cytosine-5)-methyltransferase 1
MKSNFLTKRKFRWQTSKPIKGADLFCGAGGTTTGAKQAFKRLEILTEILAINHAPLAIRTHSHNHPEERHLLTSLDSVNPRDHFKRGECKILYASPECTGHSTAAAGAPINEQSRATAHCVTRWADDTMPDVMLIENVPEFRKWGPCIRKRVKGKMKWVPDPKREGELYRAWIALIEVTHIVEARVLCCADYGSPTTRRRLIIQCIRRGSGRKIVWPNPRFAKEATAMELFSGTERPMLPWRVARQCIDLTDKGISIYRRKEAGLPPLSPNTFRRIVKGVELFGDVPFIVPQQRGGKAVKSLDEPLSPITTTMRGEALVEPFIVKMRGTAPNQLDGSAQGLDEPSPTITCSKTLYLAQPVIVDVNHGNGSEGTRANGRRVQTLDEPLKNVTCTNGKALAEFIVSIDNQGKASARADGNLKNGTKSLDEPLTTVSTKARHTLVQAFLVKYYGTASAVSLDEPMDTITTKDRFGLVTLVTCSKTIDGLPCFEINGETFCIDILLRMLTPKELAACQGFPPDYWFAGNKSEQVKQIGNAVPPDLAEAVTLAAWTQEADISQFFPEDYADNAADHRLPASRVKQLAAA